MNSVAEATLLSWAFEPLPAIGLLITAAIYLRGWSKLQRSAPARFPLRRLVFFLLGLTSLYIAIASPLDAFGGLLLQVHMVQHLLLTMVIPALLLLGAPQLPLLCGLPRVFVRQAIAPFFHWNPLKKLAAILVHPAIALPLFMLSNVAWHLPPLYELALHSMFWHGVEHICFLITALLFWWPVIQPWPSRPVWPQLALIPYLLIADLQNTALAAFLLFYDRVLYSTYAAAPRIANISALQDQAAAGAIMWVPGSIVYLVPAGLIAARYLMPKHGVRPSEMNLKTVPPIRPASAPIRSARFDLLTTPVLGAVLRWKPFRRLLQFTLFLLALLVVVDGILGPQISPMNLAGVLPWTYWRGFTVIALLVAGNLFCMACPFTFFRDIGRKFLPANLHWPKALRSKWPAIALLVFFFWAYETFDLWDRPAATAWMIIGYFTAAFLVDGFFRNASFCKYVCPIGQFHFVSSLVSPLEIKIREPDVCATCKTHDCIRGNSEQRGCELHLFQPRKSGNMDCTFCLDCVKACPHDNIGILAAAPGADLFANKVRSSVGQYAKRTDIAALVLLLTFAAFANAAGMVTPVLRWEESLRGNLGPTGSFVFPSLLLILSYTLLPVALSLLCGSAARHFGRTNEPLLAHINRFVMAFVPLGFSMWLAHFVFHFFTGSHTALPVVHRAARDVGLIASEPRWSVPSLAFSDLPALEILFLDAGLLLTLYVLWCLAKKTSLARPSGLFVPWAILALALYAAGIWIIFQPMEMRGTLMH